MEFRSRIRLAADELAHLEREVARLVSVLDREAILHEATRILTEEVGFNCAWFAERADEDYRRHSLWRADALCDQDMVLQRGRGRRRQSLRTRKDGLRRQYLALSRDHAPLRRTIVAERVQGIIGTPISYDGMVEGVLMGGSRGGTTFGDGAARSSKQSPSAQHRRSTSPRKRSGALPPRFKKSASAWRSTFTTPSARCSLPLLPACAA